MITVTQSAREELKRILVAHSEDPDVGLRLTPGTQSEYELLLDGEKDGDEVFKHEGSKVLFVPKDLSNALDGVTVDFAETDSGPRLVIR
jgi:Fe-S cluster assembly iron-binding protein IscA